MELCKTSNFSIFTFINASDLNFCTRSYSSCVYCMVSFSNGKVCKMMTSHLRTLCDDYHSCLTSYLEDVRCKLIAIRVDGRQEDRLDLVVSQFIWRLLWRQESLEKRKYIFVNLFIYPFVCLALSSGWVFKKTVVGELTVFMPLVVVLIGQFWWRWRWLQFW